MSYSKSIFFIPVWFDQFKPFMNALENTGQWMPTDPQKFWVGYLFRYAADLTGNKDLFASFTLKDPASPGVYMFGEELQTEDPPVLEEVRFSCFATGVGFLEFWVSYAGWTAEQISNFSYMFKKATSKCNKSLPEGQRALYDAALRLVPVNTNAIPFFSASARFKYECNCFHFLHLDQPVPETATLQSSVYRLSRSYRNDMPSPAESAYDVIYETGDGDYWGCCTEGLANIVYDIHDPGNEKRHYYLHNLKPQCLQTDYYFAYLLLLNQKYTAVEYIRIISQSLSGSSRDTENLNRRIILLKNTFSFNVISDDSIVQNVYAKMCTVLEIRNLLENVIENEKQLELLQKSKHMNADRLSNKYLLGISILSLFSALIDAASYFDRVNGIRSFSTLLSFVCVLLISVICVIWVFHSKRE